MVSVISLSVVLMAAAPASRSADNGANLRVMSFNIRYGTAKDGEDRWERRRELLFDVIRRYGPDVLGVQEALHFQLNEIRTSVPGYAQVGGGRDDGKEKGEYSAILYRQDRLRAVESGTFWFSDTPEAPGSKTWGNTLPRICSWALFEDRTTGRSFYAYNAHLDHQSQPSREKSVELLARRIAARKPAAPVIVTGDFNAGENNPAIVYLLGRSGEGRETRVEGRVKDAAMVVHAKKPSATAGTRLVDTFCVLHPNVKDTGTFHGFKGRSNGAKIDYILASPELKVLAAEIMRDSRDGRYPSDHYPVSATLRLAGQ